MVRLWYKNKVITVLRIKAACVEIKDGIRKKHTANWFW